MKLLREAERRYYPEQARTIRQGIFLCPSCGKECVRNYWYGQRQQTCGCIHSGTKHGLSSPRHPLYGTWHSMRSRCRNPKVPSYARYGGRGISICAEWDNFPAFLTWALHAGWQPGLFLDRRDNDGNYSPHNCRFITLAASNRNRSNTQLTPELASTIRERLATGEQRAVIARSLGIAKHHVSNVQYNRCFTQ